MAVANPILGLHDCQGASVITTSKLLTCQMQGIQSCLKTLRSAPRVLSVCLMESILEGGKKKYTNEASCHKLPLAVRHQRPVIANLSL